MKYSRGTQTFFGVPHGEWTFNVVHNLSLHYHLVNKLLRYTAILCWTSWWMNFLSTQPFLAVPHGGLTFLVFINLILRFDCLYILFPVSSSGKETTIYYDINRTSCSVNQGVQKKLVHKGISESQEFLVLTKVLCMQIWFQFSHFLYPIFVAVKAMLPLWQMFHP